MPKGANGHRLWPESRVGRAFLCELMGALCIPGEGAQVVEVEPCPWLVGWCGDNNVRWIGLQGAYMPQPRPVGSLRRLRNWQRSTGSRMQTLRTLKWMPDWLSAKHRPQAGDIGR